MPPEFTLILGGLGLITTAILNPEGIAGGLIDIEQQLVRIRGAKSSRTTVVASTIDRRT